MRNPTRFERRGDQPSGATLVLSCSGATPLLTELRIVLDGSNLLFVRRQAEAGRFDAKCMSFDDAHNAMNRTYTARGTVAE